MKMKNKKKGKDRGQALFPGHPNSFYGKMSLLGGVPTYNRL